LDDEDDTTLDLGACGRYLFAVLIQMIFITTVFGFIDLVCYGPLPGDVQQLGPLPWQAVVGIFAALSLRSRLFSPLDNSRPELENITADEDVALRASLSSGKTTTKGLKAAAEKRGLAVDNTMDRKELGRILEAYYAELDNGPTTAGGARDRMMPSWTPPGVVFPIMWVLVVAPLRAYSSALVYEASTGRINEAHLNDPVLLWLVFHLCIGDTWNTINNVERRTGAAVPGVALVWLSTLFAAKQYYDVAPQAGMVLGLSAVWITIAAVLIGDTWRINDAVRSEPLYPYKKKGRKSVTRLSFED